MSATTPKSRREKTSLDLLHDRWLKRLNAKHDPRFFNSYVDQDEDAGRSETDVTRTRNEKQALFESVQGTCMQFGKDAVRREWVYCALDSLHRKKLTELTMDELYMLDWLLTVVMLHDESVNDAVADARRALRSTKKGGRA